MTAIAEKTTAAYQAGGSDRMTVTNFTPATSVVKVPQKNLTLSLSNPESTTKNVTVAVPTFNYRTLQKTGLVGYYAECDIYWDLPEALAYFVGYQEVCIIFDISAYFSGETVKGPSITIDVSSVLDNALPVVTDLGNAGTFVYATAYVLGQLRRALTRYSISLQFLCNVSSYPTPSYPWQFTVKAQAHAVASVVDLKFRDTNLLHLCRDDSPEASDEEDYVLV